MIGGKDGVENGVLWSNWETFFVEVLNRLKKSLNCHFDPQMIHLLPAVANPNLQDNLEIDVGQKYGVAIHVINFAKVLKGTNPSDFDLSVCFDTTALSVLTPPSKLVPQYFLLFRVFTPVVWIFIIMTTITFVLMQYIFQYSQRGRFRQLYSETEISSYEGSSSILTVFAYFFCGSPPRLFLGRFYTGKILFLIVSFAAIIISTIFSSNMTKLFTKGVRYPEIDSIDDLAEADIFIQASDVEATSNFLKQSKLFEKLATKLTSSLNSVNKVNYLDRDIMWSYLCNLRLNL